MGSVAGVASPALAADVYRLARLAGDPAEAGALMTAVVNDRKAAEARFAAGFDLLKAQPGTDGNRIAAIGYCFGGAVVLHAARLGLPLRGVVSFHGALGSAHADAGRCSRESSVTAPPTPGAGQRRKRSSTRWTRQRRLRFVTYDNALHSFTNPDADSNGRSTASPVRRGGRSSIWQDMQSSSPGYSPEQARGGPWPVVR